MSQIPTASPIRFKHVLFVTDFSSCSETALPHAIALAAAYGGKVHIGHVITPQLYDLVPPDFVPKLLEQSTAYVQRRMEGLIKGADFGAVPYEVLLEQGELWQSLRRLADQYGIDVIALCTGGRRGLHVAPEAPEDPEIVTRLEQFLPQRLDQFLDEQAFHQKQLESRIEFGIPADSVLKLASGNDVDLIVMRVRGAASLTRPTCHLGTNTYRVVSEAPCPVLAVAS